MPLWNVQPYLSSPRSLEACRINGVQENELLILPLEYFLETSKESMEAVQMRYHRFEELRYVIQPIAETFPGRLLSTSSLSMCET